MKQNMGEGVLSHFIPYGETFSKRERPTLTFGRCEKTQNPGHLSLYLSSNYFKFVARTLLFKKNTFKSH